MYVDCAVCAVREENACGDCVISVILDQRPALGPQLTALPAADQSPAGPRPGRRLEMDAAEQQALTSLAGAGLVPALRHRPERAASG